MYVLLCIPSDSINVDVDFPRTLAPAVWLWFKCLSLQLAVYFCVSECYWKRNREGSLRKCFPMAVSYMWLSLNWNKCLGQLQYELLFQSVIGIILPFLIFSQVTVHLVTLFHLKVTIILSVKRCTSCLAQYSGSWCLMHLNTEMKSQVKTVLVENLQ